MMKKPVINQPPKKGEMPKGAYNNCFTIGYGSKGKGATSGGDKKVV